MEQIWRDTATLRARMIDDAIRSELIGTVIQDFSVKEIPHRKHMVLLTIRTSAKPVRDGNAIIDTSNIKLKVKL